MSPSVIGWVATATQISSYLFRKEKTLTRIQAMAAVLWLIFGIAIGSWPVVAANVMVCGAAFYASLRGHGLGKKDAIPTGEAFVRSNYAADADPAA